MGWPHAKRIVASGLEGGRGERQGAADSRPDESTPPLAEQVAGPSVTDRKRTLFNSTTFFLSRRESWRAAWKAAAENDKAQLIRDPTNQLLRLLSKSQGPV